MTHVWKQKNKYENIKWKYLEEKLRRIEAPSNESNRLASFCDSLTATSSSS